MCVRERAGGRSVAQRAQRERGVRARLNSPPPSAQRTPSSRATRTARPDTTPSTPLNAPKLADSGERRPASSTAPGPVTTQSNSTTGASRAAPCAAARVTATGAPSQAVTVATLLATFSIWFGGDGRCAGRARQELRRGHSFRLRAPFALEEAARLPPFQKPASSNAPCPPAGPSCRPGRPACRRRRGDGRRRCPWCVLCFFFFEKSAGERASERKTGL